mgnify:CR=1 FL=1
MKCRSARQPALWRSLLSQLLSLLALLLLMKIWPDKSPTGPILGQLGIGLEVGGRDRPPGGKSEVGECNKGAFWVASQKNNEATIFAAPNCKFRA